MFSRRIAQVITWMEAKPVRLPVDKYFVSKKIFHLKSFSRRNEKLIGIFKL